eukprot:m.768702 g.768702  ORF g.768702 m.768702 type:complete len:425 (-) comp59075_c0_seq25:100-1374(-)
MVSLVAACVLAALWTSVSSQCAGGFTSQQYDAAEKDFTAFFTANMTRGAKIVRLAFHDCVGGCDGCININQPANAGLATIVVELETLFATNNYSLSRADFWTLGSHIYMKYALRAPVGTPFPLEFQWGRVDCATAPYTAALGWPSSSFCTSHLPRVALLLLFQLHFCAFFCLLAGDFPQAMGNFSEVRRVFVDGEFGLSVQQVVALLGAHALGGASPQNSGFSGDWAHPNTSFGNFFFVNLLRFTYNHSNVGNSQLQQFNSLVGNIMMLHTDISLMTSFPVSILPDGTVTGVDPNGCVNDTNPNSLATCSAAPTSSLVSTYATNVTRFLADFSDAYMTLTSNCAPAGNRYNLTAITQCPSGSDATQFGYAAIILIGLGSDIALALIGCLLLFVVRKFVPARATAFKPFTDSEESSQHVQQTSIA